MHKFRGFVKAFASNSLAEIKLSKTRFPKIEKSGNFSARLLGILLKVVCL